ncbi:MAG TPA: tetratricopeptide repeat protein [Chitinophagaceae bacterium]|nr:tetratricopeptide repeat protein [Chitinophagaceae bacterium]
MNRIEKILDLLKASPHDNFLRHALALEYIKIGNNAAARNLFEEILTQYPDYTGSYYQLAKLLERNGNTDLAMQWYKKGMEAAKEAGDNHTFNELQSAYEDLLY